MHTKSANRSHGSGWNSYHHDALRGVGGAERPGAASGYVDRTNGVPVYKEIEECLRCVCGIGEHTCWRRGVQMGHARGVQSEFEPSGEEVYEVSEAPGSEALEANRRAGRGKRHDRGKGA